MLAGIVRFDLDLPALALGIAGVHAEQVAGKDRRFIAAGTRAHFQEQVAFVARVARYQQQRQLLLQFQQARLRGGDFLVGQLAQVGVGAHAFGGGQIGLGTCFIGQCSGNRFKLGEFARKVAETGVVGDHVGFGEQAFQFFAALGQRFQLTAQGRRHRVSRVGGGNPA